MHATDRRDFHIAHRNKVVVGDTELGEEMGQIIKHLIFHTLRTREERNACEDRVKCGGNGSQKLKGRRKKAGGSVEGTQKLEGRSRKSLRIHFSTGSFWSPII